MQPFFHTISRNLDKSIVQATCTDRLEWHENMHWDIHSISLGSVMFVAPFIQLHLQKNDSYLNPFRKTVRRQSPFRFSDALYLFLLVYCLSDAWSKILHHCLCCHPIGSRVACTRRYAHECAFARISFIARVLSVGACAYAGVWLQWKVCTCRHIHVYTERTSAYSFVHI